MNKTVEAYFDAIGLQKAYRTRIEQIVDFYKVTCPERVTDVFVTDYVAEEEGRQFENAWLFSNGYTMEAKKFASQDNFDLIPMPPIVYWVITKTEYDMKAATPGSRMTLHFTANTAVTGDLRASGENCDYLRDIFVKHIKPRAKPQTTRTAAPRRRQALPRSRR